MAKPEDKKLLEEAADIFLRLSETPDDPTAQNARDAFLERGGAERAAFEKIARAWTATGTRKKSRGLPTIVLIFIVAALGYGVFPTMQIALIADVQTGIETRAVVLASGDRVDLDASSALVDETGTGNRNVRLLKGAAYFDVDKGTRAFVVTADEVMVTVVGTAFETALHEDGVSVTVSEGIVSVEISGTNTMLEAGDRLTWRKGTVPVIDKADGDRIAMWRRDRFFAEDMRFEDVAAVIQRRLRGRLFILDDNLADLPVTGTFDLSNPLLALETLAASRGARIIAAEPLTTLVLPQGNGAQ
ncbi:MAG: FecR domain-containing protein [Pseudomonadota bacterium]